jgi:hypothetical protein
MPEVHDALARAIALRRGRRRGWRPSRRAGVIAVGALVASGSALAASGGWHPILGDDHRGHPRPAATALPAEQVAALGVLRRPQTNSDRGRDVQAVLRLLGSENTEGIHTQGIRVLKRRSDGVTVLIPTERTGTEDFPPSVQRNVLCVLTGTTAPPRTGPIGAKAPSASGPIKFPRGMSAGGTCGHLRDLRTTGIRISTPSNDGYATGGVVPDGVARVIIRLRHQRLVSATVHDNYYEASTGNELAPGWAVRWLDAQGHTIDHRRARSP